jgi:hypothetical protein
MSFLFASQMGNALLRVTSSSWLGDIWLASSCWQEDGTHDGGCGCFPLNVLAAARLVDRQGDWASGEVWVE